MECTKLTKLRLQAPQLTWFDLSGCTWLPDQELNGLIKYSSLLKTLKLKGATLIENQDFKQAFPLYSLGSANSEPLLKVLRSTESYFTLEDIVFNLSELKYLVHALNLNPILTSLNLQYTQIGDVGAQALAYNTTLKFLDLRNNQVGDVGAQALAHNTTLRFLGISNNQVSDVGERAFYYNNRVRLISEY